MTETEWLRYLNPWEMLAFIARSEMPGLGRKLLLYAASVCRRSWAQIRSKGGRRVVRVIERFADGKAGERALTKALRRVSFDPEEHPITDLAGEFAFGCIVAVRRRTRLSDLGRGRQFVQFIRAWRTARASGRRSLTSTLVERPAS
jgi:hypothetical protein